MLVDNLPAALSERYSGVRVNPAIDLTPKLLHEFDEGKFRVILVGAQTLSTTHLTLDLGAVPYGEAAG
jgi:hypothetical protein